MRSLFRTAPPVVVVFILLSATASAQEATATAELPRFQLVTERLFRSGQPRVGGLNRVRELGIDTVINLRGTSDRTRAEEKEARALGLNYYNIALPNWARPQDTRVARILEIIDAPESGRVLIHCKDGVDRTGMIVAIHRITRQAWTSEDALAEAERFGMRRIQFWMRDYVDDYGKRAPAPVAQTALTAPRVEEDFGDRLGASMRFVERGAFRARKYAGRFLRKLR